MFIGNYDDVNNNKYSVDITSGLTWQYDGPKGDIDTRPERVYNAALRDIANLLDDVLKGDKIVLKYFETEPPGNRRAWSMFLMKKGENPLPPIPVNTNNYSDNMSYNNADKRQFLAQQLKKDLAKIFSRKYVSFEDIVPKSFMNVYNVKYDKLKNVNKNQNFPGRTMTFDQMKQEAAEDIDKIKEYVLKAYEKTTPVVKGEYGILALENDKNKTIKSIPTVNKLAKDRFEKASMINAVQKQNPVLRAVSKAVIKNPRGGVNNGVVDRLVSNEKLDKRDKSLGGKVNRKKVDPVWKTVSYNWS